VFYLEGEETQAQSSQVGCLGFRAALLSDFTKPRFGSHSYVSNEGHDTCLRWLFGKPNKHCLKSASNRIDFSTFINFVVLLIKFI
jgi:hypothetical protein